ncbi:MAG: hypothetical protein ACTSUE_14970 [Promethearchaeota archaeon]
MVQSKIVMLGLPEAGKTSIRKFFFEGVPGEDIINKPDMPTVGLKYNNYSYLTTLPSDKEGKKGEKIPVSLSVVDSAGQNLKDWLGSRRERVFPGADIIFFIFDITDWMDEAKKESVEELIMLIYNQRVELAPESSFYIIAHKFDKISAKKNEAQAEKMKKKIKNELNDYIFDKMMKFLDFDIYITSLTKEYEHDCFLTLLNLTTDLLARFT